MVQLVRSDTLQAHGHTAHLDRVTLDRRRPAGNLLGTSGCRLSLGGEDEAIIALRPGEVERPVAVPRPIKAVVLQGEFHL